MNKELALLAQEAPLPEARPSCWYRWRLLGCWFCWSVVVLLKKSEIVFLQYAPQGEEGQVVLASMWRREQSSTITGVAV